MTSPAQCWPFVVATKPPAGYCDVLTPGYLDGTELRALIGAEAGIPTAPDAPVAQQILVGQEQAWLVFQVAHHPPTSLPPPGNGRRPSSSRDVVAVWGCIVRSDERPSPDIQRVATAPAVHDVCRQAFDRFWAAPSNTGWPALSSALNGDGQPVQPALPPSKPSIPAPEPTPPAPVQTVPAPAETGSRRPHGPVLVGAAALLLVLVAVVLLLLTTR
jgi:hypothetical protein